MPHDRSAPLARPVAIVGALLAVVVGAATGTLPIVLVVGLAVAGVVVARRLGRIGVSGQLEATERQLATILGAHGYVAAADLPALDVPDAALAQLVGREQLRRRARFLSADGQLEIATVIASDGSGRGERPAVTVARRLHAGQDTPAASALLEVAMAVPPGDVPPSTRFVAHEGWLLAAFSPTRVLDPGEAAASVARRLSSIADDARKRG